MIKVFHLISDEDIISEVVSEKDGVVVLKNPAKIMTQPTPQGMGIGLIPMSFFMEEKKNVEISLNHIVFSGEPEAEIRNAYSQQFGGVVIASPGNTINLNLKK